MTEYFCLDVALNLLAKMMNFALFSVLLKYFYVDRSYDSECRALRHIHADVCMAGLKARL